MARFWKLCGLGGLLVTVLASGGPATARAQALGRVSAGLEAGLPLVLGLEASYLVTPRWRAGMAIGRLGGLTALRAEARWLLRPEERERVVPSIVVGAEQYFLKDGDRDATPVGIHAALGLDYYMTSPVSVGARVGGLKTFGSSDSGDLRVFSVQNGYTSGMFNIGVRYHF